jgi:hypothetical protein
MSEYFLDMGSMLCQIVGVDEHIIQVDDDADVEHIGEDVIHEALESSGGVGQSEWHNKPLKQAIAGAESCFPFISFSYSDKVIGVLKVDFRVDTRFTRAIKKIGDQGEWITVLDCELVESSEIDT